MATHPQYSCLENPMGRVVWRATVHGVTKSQTLLRIAQHMTYIKEDSGQQIHLLTLKYQREILDEAAGLYICTNLNRF